MKRIFILGNRSLLLQCDTMTQQTKKNLKCVLISRLFSLNTSLLPSPYHKYRRKTFKNAYFGHIQIVTVKNEHLVWSSLRVWNDKVHSVSRLWNFPLAPLVLSLSCSYDVFLSLLSLSMSLESWIEKCIIPKELY